MECPKCGSEIPEGKLYCPSCGYAVQIVPDYDADLEENLSSVGSDIAGTVNRIDVAENSEVEFDVDSTTREIPMVKKDEVSELMKRRAIETENREKMVTYFGAAVLVIVLILATLTASRSFGNLSFVPVKAVDDVVSESASLNVISRDIELPTEEMPEKEWEDEEEDLISAVSEEGITEDTSQIELVVTPESGSYSRPQGIKAKSVIENGADGEVVDNKTGTIYFTRDGSEPGENSEVFKKEIPMPLGHSTFAFRFLDEDGNPGETIRVEYDLEYAGAACTTTDAANLIIATLIKDGALLDIYGHVLGSTGAYTYQCNSMITMDDRDYFLIPESYEEPGKAKKKTGTVYAVDAVNLSMYKVNQDSSGKYSFEVFF